MLHRRHLPLQDILRTREGISNGTMIDIGANIGLTSVTRAILGDASVVYAAEPAPDNFGCLVRTVIDNGLQGIVLPDRVAIGDRDGTATMRISGSIGGHALREGADGIEVPTLRLDTWVRTLGIDAGAVCYVKVDTQGYESHVLDGAPDLLARPGVVWELEFAPLFLPKVGREPAAVLAQMQAAFTYFIDLNESAPGARAARWPNCQTPSRISIAGLPICCSTARDADLGERGHSVWSQVLLTRSTSLLTR